MAKKPANYDASAITVLEGLEPVRKRPAMYIGGTDTSGYHHLLWEIVDNSVDEVINGFASRIEVTLHKDGKSVTVTDDGRGIPVDVMPKYKSRRWRSSSPRCTRAGSSSRATTCTPADCTASALRW
jgi:DNA gyrase/topoisomerase IV subunit B